MDKEKKLEILAQSDFSQWRESQRLKNLGLEYLQVSGFGSAFHGLYGGLTNIADDILPDSALEVVETAYDFLQSCYKKIPFGQMDKNDEDFRFLFNYKEKLDELGLKLKKFINKFHQDGKISRDSEEFIEVMDVVEQLNIRNYRRDILRKYHIDLFTPTSQ